MISIKIKSETPKVEILENYTFIKTESTRLKIPKLF